MRVPVVLVQVLPARKVGASRIEEIILIVYTRRG
jgi:hypothetical protein